jgi:hypothetical protein
MIHDMLMISISNFAEVLLGYARIRYSGVQRV